MNIATFIHEMRSTAKKRSAFTLIELLVVIAIIALIASLVVGLSGVAGKEKRQKRVRTELAKLVILIEAYKSKVGMYPPDNPSDPDRNSLLYELAGAVRDHSIPANPRYITPFDDILTTEIWAVYGGYDVFSAPDRAGLVNAVERGTQVDPDVPKMYRLLTKLQSDQYATVAGQLSLFAPVDGPNGRPNPWSYARGTNAVHNPDSFDLWVDVVIGDQTNRIGNWKK